MYKTKAIEELNIEVLQLKQRLQELQTARDKQLSAFNELTEQQKLAVQLHDQLCRSNHTDQCGFMYEIKDGRHTFVHGSEHQHWHHKAGMFMKFCESEEIDPQAWLKVERQLKKATI